MSTVDREPTHHCGNKNIIDFLLSYFCTLSLWIYEIKKIVFKKTNVNDDFGVFWNGAVLLDENMVVW